MSDVRAPVGFEDFWLQLRGPIRFTPDQLRSASFRTHLKNLVARAPVPVVNVVAGVRSVGGLRRHVDYISRGGELALITRDGERLKGLDDLQERVEDWARDRFAFRSEQHRFAVNLVLSMPPGTPHEPVFRAGEQFAKAYFGTDWLMARHDDEPHPHLHISLRGQTDEGRKLSFGPAELHKMRGRFAEALHHHGVEACAAPRWARGIAEKPLRREVYRLEEAHLEGRGAEPKYVEADITEAQGVVAGRQQPPRPWEDRIKTTQQHVRDRYLIVADGLDRLGGQEDRELAEKVRQFVAQMPAPLTKREQLVEDIRAMEASKSWTRDRERNEAVLER